MHGFHSILSLYLSDFYLYTRVIDELTASDSTYDSDDEEVDKRNPFKYVVLIYCMCGGMVTYRRVIEKRLASDSTYDSDDEDSEAVHKRKLYKYISYLFFYGIVISILNLQRNRGINHK